MEAKMVAVTAPMSEQLDARARLGAARLKISRSELVRRAVGAYLERLETKEAKDGMEVPSHKNNL